MRERLRNFVGVALLIYLFGWVIAAAWQFEPRVWFGWPYYLARALIALS